MTPRDGTVHSGMAHTCVATPQIVQTSSWVRPHRATGTKNTVSRLDSSTRAHVEVLPQFGQVRTDPGPRSRCLVPKPKKKNTPSA